ncbi:MAG: alpha/beta hydrolase [Novosphingobium sp.]|nr:alpha/beta hydrolase [Novosphingobium sp.]
MTSRPLIDPEVAPLINLLPPLELNDASIGPIREMLGAPNPDLPPPPFEPQRRYAPGLDGGPDVPVLVFDPPHRAGSGAILHIHGGGMVMGTAAISNLSNAALALALGVPIVSVDYRLAPENPFPAPQMDCLAAYDWLVANARELGADPARIVLSGESAGGGLAAALALMIRDTGRQAPAGQILTYPMLDHRTGGEGHPGLANTGEFIWTREANRYGWAALRGGYAADDERAGWFSPALATDLSGLPPVWIAVGALDLFLAEDLAYAQRLVEAGVPVEAHVYPGCIHGFNIMPGARMTAAYDRDLKSALGSFLGL